MDFTLSQAVIWLCGLGYAAVAVEQGLKGNTGMAIAYSGYAFSNLGLAMWAK